MTLSSALVNLSKRMPPIIRRPLGRLRTVLRRQIIWTKVRLRLRGVTRADQRILNRAMAHSIVRSWRDLHRWQFPIVDDDCTVTSRGVGTFRVRRRTDDLFHILPGQEPAVEAAIRSRLSSGDTFVDAGSNIGFYTVLASKLVDPRGRVIACEKMPTTANILRDHVALNGCHNVEVHEGALASAAGLSVEASVRPGKYGSASIARRAGGEAVAVRTITLADILQDVSRVRLMKMDLEGAELGALQGLEAALSKVDAIVFEHKGGADAVNFLIAHGFRCRRIDGANALAERDDALTR